MGEERGTKIEAGRGNDSRGVAPLPEREVHVWIAPLDLPDSAAAERAAWLDADEEARAARFRFPRDRRAFTVARGTLRILLGRYLGRSAGLVRLSYGPHGKPALADAGANPLRFNVSHSGELGVFAFARSSDVGVDVEHMRALSDLDGIAERFFSAEEVSALRRIAGEARREAFYRCWTAKEAYIKGVGEGLSMPLDRFAVSLDPTEGAVRLRVLRGPAPPGAWRLHRFEPRPGYVAAVAVAGRSFRIRFREWGPGEPAR